LHDVVLFAASLVILVLGSAHRSNMSGKFQEVAMWWWIWK